MGSLRDQLLKAKLITQKQAKDAATEKRQKRKQLAPSAVDKEKQAQQERFEKARQVTAETQRQLARDQQERQEKVARTHRIRDIIRNGEIAGGRGNIRFYFVTQDGRIWFLNVTDAIQKELIQGNAAIIRYPDQNTPHYGIVQRETARKLMDEMPELVRFKNF